MSEKIINPLEQSVVVVESDNKNFFDSYVLYNSIHSQKVLEENLENFFKLKEIKDNPDIFPILEKSFKDALGYAENYLKIHFPKTIEKDINNLNIKNKKDLENFLKKTVLYKKINQEEKKDIKLGLKPLYSAITKIAIAEFLYHKDELQEVIKSTEKVYNNLTTKVDGVQNIFVPKENPKQYNEIFVYNDENKKMINAVMCWRGKSQNSIITKLLNKKENNLTEAIKDGIGLKFEVQSTDDAVDIIKMIIQSYYNRFKAENFVIKNVNLIGEEEKKRLKNIKLQDGKIINLEISGNYNPNSNDNFKTLKIAEGTIEIDGKKIGSEVQVVLVDNKNETGFAHHSIYEAKKKLNIYSRLLGYFDDKYIKILSEEASKDSGINEKKIFEYLKKDLQKIRNIKTGKIKYMTKTAYKEFNKNDLIK